VDTAGSHRVFETMVCDCVVVVSVLLLVMANAGCDDADTVAEAIAIFAVEWNTSRRLSPLSISI